MNKIFSVFLISAVLYLGCEQKPSQGRVNQSSIQSFRLSISNSSFVATEAPVIILTEKNIRVLKGIGADSLQFISPIGYSDTLSRISELSPLSLDSTYSNDCIADGLQLSVIYSKGDTIRHVQIRNFYQPDLGNALEFLNVHLPEKFRIVYDRQQLEADYEKCKEHTLKQKEKH